MEWLMGKARGVGRNLISSSGSQNSSNLSVSPPRNNSLDAQDYPRFSRIEFLNQQIPEDESVRLEDLIKPFPRMKIDEWLAYHSISIFENVVTFFDTLCELCLCSNLKATSFYSLGPLMDASYNHSFESFVTAQLSFQPLSTSVNASNTSARQAIDAILNDCNLIIESHKIFPVRYAEQFPSDLHQKVSGLCHKMILCLTHLYVAHFHDIEKLELIPHLNTLAKHFFLFTRDFNLLEEKDFEPLCGFHKQLISTNAPLIDTATFSKNSSFSNAHNIQNAPVVNSKQQSDALTSFQDLKQQQ